MGFTISFSLSSFNIIRIIFWLATTTTTTTITNELAANSNGAASIGFGQRDLGFHCWDYYVSSSVAVRAIVQQAKFAVKFFPLISQLFADYNFELRYYDVTATCCHLLKNNNNNTNSLITMMIHPSNHSSVRPSIDRLNNIPNRLSKPLKFSVG